MNRADRNAIREATTTIDTLTAQLATLTEERDKLKRSNAALRGTVTKLKNERGV